MAGFIPLEPLGVVGTVKDRSGAAVTGGTVYFVSASAVATLPAITVATVNTNGAAATNDEPLEDLIATSGASMPQAVVNADGSFVLVTLPAGSYFVTFMPALNDPAHLPGGSACRIARTSASLVNTRLDLQVSSATPAGATYVGTSRCVACHGKASIAKTLHRVGIWSPYSQGLLQDTAARPEMYQALNTKFTPGTTVWFYGYDATRGFDKWRTAEADPGTGACTGVGVPANCVDFTVRVRRTGNDWEMLFTNVANPADPANNSVRRVDAVYGGGLLKQRYMNKTADGATFYYNILPLQFQNEGSEAALYGRTSKVWRDYNSYKWFNATTKLFTVPARSNSFEKNCLSCHASTARVTGSDTTQWSAALIRDPLWGDFDYDGDGNKDEVNLGCETCHGPGSAHWDAAGQGKLIVSPSLLTPERENMICGQCHSRPKGAFGTDSPVNAAGLMMVAGTARRDFLAQFATTQEDGAASDFFAAASDPAEHSKSHHQQYSDHLRSRHYRNGSYLMTCAECHDPHAVTNPRQLFGDKSVPAGNAALCGASGCHTARTTNQPGHLDTVLGAGQGANKGNLARCADCHMPKTAKTGSGTPGIVSAPGATQYWNTDISSHLFDMPRKALSRITGANMPTGYINACAGVCHAAGP
jgi:hypothetical protein